MTASSATDDETDGAKVAEVDVEAAVAATGMASIEGGSPSPAVLVLGETGGETRSALVRPARGWSFDIRRVSALLFPFPSGEDWAPSTLSSSSLRSGSTETVASLALLCLR